MITKAELVGIARKRNLPLGLIEKDFVLTLVLAKIYDSVFKEILVFKGGTALHILYLHKRLSVDLDFTALETLDITAFKKVLEISELNSKVKKTTTSENSISIGLKYKSLLDYPDSIKIDISFREKPLLELKHVVYKSPYSIDAHILTFQIEELASEKIRALMQRKRPRDYFDLWCLLKKIKFNNFESLANKKMLAVGDNADLKKVFTDLDAVKSLWKNDLIQLVPELPDFDVIIADLKTGMKQTT